MFVLFISMHADYMWSLISTSCQLLLQSESKFVYVWNARVCDTTVFCHSFDGNLYIFELQRLGLICKELALLTCSLTVVYPGLIPSHTRTYTSLDSSVSVFSSVFFFLYELLSCCRSDIAAKLTDGSLMWALAGQKSQHETKPGPSL